MSQRMVRTRVESEPSPGDSERRIAQRYGPGDVPWLVTIKPAVGEVAQLVNISQSGVLLDCRDRLPPGRRITLLATTADDRVQRMPVIVIRTHIVAFSADGSPIYRTALMFETALDWSFVAAHGSRIVPGLATIADGPSASHSENAFELFLEGPLDGGLSSARGSEAAVITGLTEAGCVVRVPGKGGANPGDDVRVTLLFSPTYRMTLNGRVATVVSDDAFTVRFGNISAAEGRLLRAEMRSYAARRSQRQGAVDRAFSFAAAPHAAAGGGPSSLPLEGNVW